MDLEISYYETFVRQIFMLKIFHRNDPVCIFIRLISLQPLTIKIFFTTKLS